MPDKPAILALDEIVTAGLCIGCGLCEAVAGRDRVRIVRTREGRERPAMRGVLDDDTNRLINDICPGLHIEGRAFETVDGNTDRDPVWGEATRLAIGHAGDRDIRFRAATGGVLTALAIRLLESGAVSMIVHVAPDPQAPARSICQISRNRADVLAGMGSRYGPAAALSRMDQVLEENQPFAIVAKPCDIGAIRNLARSDRRLADNLKLCLAMVCGGASEFGKTEQMLDDMKIPERDVTLLRYRGHGNPGPTRVEASGGRVEEVSYNQLWEDEGSWRLQFRCKICPDATGELADIAASDVWPGGGPSGEDEGFNGIIARTAKGAELVDAAFGDGTLVKTADMTFRDLDHFQPHQVRKKQAVFDRIEGLADAGFPRPDFTCLRLEEQAATRPPDERQMQRQGAVDRARAGRMLEPRAEWPE